MFANENMLELSDFKEKRKGRIHVKRHLTEEQLKACFNLKCVHPKSREIVRSTSASKGPSGHSGGR